MKVKWTEAEKEQLCRRVWTIMHTDSNNSLLSATKQAQCELFPADRRRTLYPSTIATMGWLYSDPFDGNVALATAVQSKEKPQQQYVVVSQPIHYNLISNK
jgi:hypothetical protein